MARSIIFDILAVDSASPTFTKVGMAAGTMSTKVKSAGAMASKGFLVAGVAAGALGIHAIKMAGDFDAAIVRLETTAGESHAALATVSNGLLDMAGKVGFTAQELAKGMYTVESAGYHGAAGLKVMEAASKGARVEGADLTVVTDAVSSLLVDYHLKAGAAARVTNILTAAVGHGKTTFEGMAGALPNVAAAGATAKISMAELASAIATMTMHGTDASKAGTYLRQVIGQLEAPSAKARTVMKGLGIDANQLGLTLSSGSGHGLADAIKMVDTAITNNLTPKGLVAIKTFRDSTHATSDYKKMLADLPPAYTTTFGALSNMVGGVKSLQGFLQLGGENLKTYRNNVKAVREQVRKGGTDVEGFAQQQGTLNGKLNDAKGATSALAVRVGQDLTPAAKVAVTAFANLTTGLAAHDQVVTKVVIGLTAMAAALTVVKVAQAAAAATTVLLGGAEVTLALQMAAGALVTGDMAGAMAALSMAMDANPVGLVVIAIAALVAGFILAYKHSEKFRSAVQAVGRATAWAFHAITAGVGNAIGFIKSHWPLILGILAGPIALAVVEIIQHWGKVKAFLGKVVSWFAALPDRILGAIGDLGGLLVGAGKAIIQGLLDGIGSMVGKLTSKLHSITNLIPKHKGPLDKDRMLLTPAGKAIMDGLIHGIESGRVRLETALDKVTAFIAAQNDKIQSLISARNGIVDSFTSMSSSVFSQDFADQGGPSIAAIISYQQAQLAKAMQAQADVARVVSMGLSKALVTQLANSGSTGLASLHALAMGPQSAITQLNSLDAQTSASLSAAGMTAGNTVYGSQIQAAQADMHTAQAIRRELEKWRKQEDKNTVIELHIGGKVLRATLLELKRHEGNKPLGLA
jgi:TP901 family phage tail tape measure protein